MSTEESTAAAPRLMSNAARSWASTGIMLVGGVVFVVVAGLLGVGEREDDEGQLFLVALLVAYVLLFVSYQGLTWWTVRGAGAEELVTWANATSPRSRRERRRAALLGVGGRSWAITAALLAMASVLAISVVEGAQSPVVVTLSLVLVALAWTNVAVAFAVSYLREHAARPGLRFPDDAAPAWSDLWYLAVQVSTTFSSSDVEVTTSDMRRLVTAQSIVAFVFNTVIVALLVSSLLTLGA